jgi:hypothetical protein
MSVPISDSKVAKDLAEEYKRIGKKKGVSGR